MSKNLDERRAVVDHAMCVVEIPNVGQEVVELGTAEAVAAPVDLGLSASPRLVLKDRRQALPVKSGVTPYRMPAKCGSIR